MVQVRRWLPVSRRSGVAGGLAAAALAVAGSVALVAGMSGCDDLVGTGQHEAAGTPVPHGYVRADSTVLGNGTHVTLWVTPPAPAQIGSSRCFFLEMAPRTGGRGGVGACQGPGRDVTLARLAGAVVGSAGDLPARTAVVSSPGAEAASVPVTSGYFLLPAKVLGPSGTAYSVTVRDAAEQALGTFTVKPSG
jgi:hypothetical protein